MEQRREVFVQNGYYIRKLNQAYFAFHGNYAEGGASSSPIGGEVQALRQRSASVGDFIRRIAGIGKYTPGLGLDKPAAEAPTTQPAPAG